MLTEENKTSDVNQEKSAPNSDTATGAGTSKAHFKMSLLDLKSIDKKILIIAGIAIVIVIALIVALSIYFSPINKFDRALNSENFSLAQEIFEENLQDDKFAAAANEALESHLTSIEESYINDEITYEAAQEATKAVDLMMSARSRLNMLEIIFNSKAALKSAEEAEKNTDFYSAIEQYGKIAPEDTKDYAIVEERISAAKSSLVAKALEDAASSVQSGDYDAAISTLVAVQDAGYATSEIDSALIECAAGMVEACKEPEDYYKAYDRIKELNRESTQAVLSQAISSASAATVSEAESLVSQRKYIDAFKVLSLPKGDFITPEVESALKNCTDLAAGAILSDVETMKSNGQYKEAYELLCKTDSNLLTDAVKAAKDECEGLYTQSVLDSAAQLAEQGDYDGAIAAINEGQRLLSGQGLKDKAEEYRLEKLKAEQLVTVESTDVGQSYIFNKAIVVIKNQTDKVLKEYSVGIIMLDSNGYPVNNTYSHQELLGYKNVCGGRADSANVQPGKTYGSNIYWNIEGDCDQILACVISAEFYDGTSWDNPYFLPWVAFYAERPVQ